jgi:predicted phage tail protein
VARLFIISFLDTSPGPPFFGSGESYDGKVGGDVLKVENLSGRFIISAAKQNAAFSTIKFAPKTKNSIKIRVTRVRSYGGATFQIFDDLSWSSINTRFDTNPIVTTQRHVFLEIRIKATDQLNGSITNLNGVAQSALDVYDDNTGTWSRQLTNNPAWIYADILTGPINKRSIEKSRLDTDSIIEYAQFCDEIPTPPPGSTYIYPRFESNFLLDYKTTVKDLVNQVLGQCQASLNIINGRYGILVDKRKTVPVQVFTTRNSSDFASSRTYSKEPDALKVSYIDRTSDWQSLEEIVYADGFDENTAVNFEEVGSFAVTNDQQAWRYGRYLMAQSRLRKENISIRVDFEKPSMYQR